MMPNSFFFEQNTTVNDKSTAGRFDLEVFVNCVQDQCVCVAIVAQGLSWWSWLACCGKLYLRSSNKVSEGGVSVGAYVWNVLKC